MEDKEDLSVGEAQSTKLFFLPKKRSEPKTVVSRGMLPAGTWKDLEERGVTPRRKRISRVTNEPSTYLQCPMVLAR